jgi:hypothetical protein
MYFYNTILGDKLFPENPEQAIINGVQKAESEFIKQSTSKGNKAFIEKSGSCALIVLILSKPFIR